MKPKPDAEHIGFWLSIRGVTEHRLRHDFLPFLCVIVLEIRQYSCVLCLDKEQKIMAEVQDF